MSSVPEVFKALGDPIRVRIVEMLAKNGEMCVCEIIEELEMSQPAVSHHLAVLKNAGVVRARKQANWVHYSLCASVLTEVAIAFLQNVVHKLDIASKTSLEACGERCEK